MGRDESTDRVARSFLAFLSLFSVKCLTKDAPRAEQFFCVGTHTPPSKKNWSLSEEKKKKSAPAEREREKTHVYEYWFTPYNRVYSQLTKTRARARNNNKANTHAQKNTHIYNK